MWELSESVSQTGDLTPIGNTIDNASKGALARGLAGDDRFLAVAAFHTARLDRSPGQLITLRDRIGQLLAIEIVPVHMNDGCSRDGICGILGLGDGVEQRHNSLGDQINHLHCAVVPLPAPPG